ncbi:MAG TPA: ribosome maturation factor RimP [Candidatus Flavonifractor merdigallinarum]|uniref:Ribosome maturation factor RimP n=1 Tax=Candidatus Flavonifractor merdigallinarum TaxID=2838589 RepID=A0A9D1Y7Z6_9FIRM|nr:ribosome maturation factor RimP [Candidatus Flavonifractor merdigallinarum]
MAKVTEVVTALAAPIVQAQGCRLWDVEYVKEAGTWYLRVFIDKDGGVSIDDCEAVSRPLSDALDEADPIEGSYTLEVGSAGIDRVLRRPEHFAAYLGSEVEVRLYRAREGRKELVGKLLSYENGGVTLELDGAPVALEKKEIAQVRLYVRF